ncbi:MAG: flavin reductase family protein [Elusimicrobiota bacterium]
MKIELDKWYRILAPRPVVILTTVNKDGVVNAAPFSFVMPVSSSPAMIAVAMAEKRHTFDNLIKTGEFVVNIPGKTVINGLWITGKPFSAGVNELVEAKLESVPSNSVKPPRIKDCFGWLECKFVEQFPAGDHIVVLGEIVSAEVVEGVYNNDELNLEKTNPLGHIGGKVFTIPGKKLVVKE